jgi:AcrR family transcriptional regulator
LAQAAGSTKSLAHNEARSALIESALRVISTDGAASMHPNELCLELGIARSLVNFHFGGRDGLVAEAMALGYERYVSELKRAADAAGPEPLDRLLAWVDRQVEWTIANPGLAAALNFQREASGMHGGMPDEVAAHLAETGARNFNFLIELVRAVRESNGVATDSSTLGFDGAVVGWLTLGLSVWLAGRHTPTQHLARPDLVKLAKERAHRLIAGMLEV